MKNENFGTILGSIASGLPRRKLRLALDVRLEPIQDGLFRLGSDDPVNFLAAFENEERRDALDMETSRRSAGWRRRRVCRSGPFRLALLPVARSRVRPSGTARTTPPKNRPGSAAPNAPPRRQNSYRSRSRDVSRPSKAICTARRPVHPTLPTRSDSSPRTAGN